jgi:hypothetical protein
MKFDTAPTSDPAIEHFVQRFKDVLDADIQGDHDGDIKCMQIFALHKVLVRDPSLYIQVSEALAERGILSRACLKDVVTRAKELGAGQ